MSKTGRHIITREDGEELLAILELIESKPDVCLTDAERKFRTWMNGYLRRLWVSEQKRSDYKRQNRD